MLCSNYIFEEKVREYGKYPQNVINRQIGSHQDFSNMPKR
jgi:hypothetical protein